MKNPFRYFLMGMIKPACRHVRRLGFSAGVIAAPLVAQAQLAFDLHYESNLDSRALHGLELAAHQWGSLLADPVTISLDVHFDTHTDDLANTEPTILQVNFSDFRQALDADRRSSADLEVKLSSTDSFRLLTNFTADNPHGAGSRATYLDANESANNQTVALSQANARALGLYATEGGGLDASIFINSSYDYDFDPSDGIGVGKVDFVGVATHEIGHALGFLSGTSLLDYAGFADPGSLTEDDLAYVSSLDLFRYSQASHAFGSGVIDWSADDREKYFSIDGGATSLELFATGTYFGDGQEASHWKDGLGIGIMDPTQSYGELRHITETDVLALDVIGYDRRHTSVPDSLPTGVAAIGWLAMMAVAKRSGSLAGKLSF